MQDKAGKDDHRNRALVPLGPIAPQHAPKPEQRRRKPGRRYHIDGGGKEGGLGHPRQVHRKAAGNADQQGLAHHPAYNLPRNAARPHAARRARPRPFHGDDPHRIDQWRMHRDDRKVPRQSCRAIGPFRDRNPQE